MATVGCCEEGAFYHQNYVLRVQLYTILSGRVSLLDNIYFLLASEINVDPHNALISIMLGILLVGYDTNEKYT